MKLLMLLLCHAIYAEKHSVTILFTGSVGLTNLPEVVSVEVVDGNQVVYCNSNGTLEPRQRWLQQLYGDDPQLLQQTKQECFESMPTFFRLMISSLKQHFNQSEGIHIVQRIGGCEVDNETGELTGILQYGYNGEGFIAFDLKTLTWVALKPEAEFLKNAWDNEKHDKQFVKDLLTKTYLEWLQNYFVYGKSFLLRTDLPSVSLLQKNPSSPVSCYATGFYPNSALLFWRKDGEEIHEDVTHGDILSNHDGTFQIGVKLDISSLRPEDWGRYDCVFQFSGVTDKIITKLDKTVIRTNRKEKGLSVVSIATTATAAVVIVFIIVALGLTAIKYKSERSSSPERTSSPSSDTIFL
ncbi:major histocompatibility complex class I-related gene protein-like [Melanotaenia boesemani]|uniref:major histocompatibility complex class I-related gene protein-like n=1 Tax=Melanotaenia boesemani TaxID=1250792 RepID=UPI001C050CB9|nr:major histocompatibility complex class I-related gene protein-like [Melanotaenia boesemani]